MKRDSIIFIAHILECIELIEEYTKETSKDKFHNSRQIQDAIIRRIEIIGEAVKNLPREVKNKYSDIPWKRIAGMRDILIHEYWGIDLNLTWNVATKEILEFKKKVFEIKKDLETGNA